VKDMLDAGGKPIVVRYQRSAERPGDIAVTDLDVIRQRQNFIVRELRLGAVPSVVLDNGMRYFEGAVLPDGDVLKRIGATELVVTRGRGDRVIPLTKEDAAPASPASPATGSPSTATPAQTAAASAFSTAVSSAVAPANAPAAGSASRP
jgi:Inner membrane component of T3SS, periplasmic domain